MRKKKGRFFIGAGLLFIAAAAALCGYNVYDGHRAGIAAQESVNYLQAAIEPEKGFSIVDDNVNMQFPAVSDMPMEEEIPDYILNPDMDMPVISYDGNDYIGILEIPAIGLEIPVMSEWSYPKLKISPCRYTGSVYKNDMVIAAHNYEAHFGSINELDEGARVTFTDVDGNVFQYLVDMKETLGPHDVEYLVDGGWDLTLFTCTPGGSYRVTVRCIADMY